MSESDSDKKSLSVKKGAGVYESVNPDFKARKGQLKSKEEYVEGILSGNRTTLSQAITLLESSRQDQRDLGQDVLEACLPHSGKSIRIGITGVPGVGKSTFIEAMGQYLTKKGKKLAVLAIDPSSTRSGGSILGDKTRMPVLSVSENVFIRPSPTSGALGGVARKTRETMLLCEAAGYDTIFIETVGVGQSETSVHSMTDFFLLLMLAGAGDELQGIKRGIMEMADLIAINKAEEGNLDQAKRAQRDYKNALNLFPPSPSEWKPDVFTCSALHQKGMKEIWASVENYLTMTRNNGFFKMRRREQAAYWMYDTIEAQLKQRFYRNSDIREKLSVFKKKVEAGEITSYRAASELMKLYERSR